MGISNRLQATRCGAGLINLPSGAWTDRSAHARRCHTGDAACELQTATVPSQPSPGARRTMHVPWSGKVRAHWQLNRRLAPSEGLRALRGSHDYWHEKIKWRIIDRGIMCNTTRKTEAGQCAFIKNSSSKVSQVKASRIANNPWSATALLTDRGRVCAQQIFSLLNTLHINLHTNNNSTSTITSHTTTNNNYI